MCLADGDERNRFRDPDRSFVPAAAIFRRTSSSLVWRVSAAAAIVMHSSRISSQCSSHCRLAIANCRLLVSQWSVSSLPIGDCQALVSQLGKLLVFGSLVLGLLCNCAQSPIGNWQSANCLRAFLTPRRGIRIMLLTAHNLRMWRNWQTRRSQKPVVVTSWRFKSSHPHQTITIASLLRGSLFCLPQDSPSRCSGIRSPNIQPIPRGEHKL